VTVHGLLLAGMLIWLPDGMPDAGPAVAGVEVELLPVESSGNAVEQGLQAEAAAPVKEQAHLQPVFEALPESPVAQRAEKKPINNNQTKAETDSSSSRMVERAEIAVPQTLLSQQPVVQGASVQEYADARSETDVSVEAEKTRNIVVRQRLEHFKHYPASARRRGIEGAVDVSFRLNAQGRAEDMQLVSGSGYGILDDAALNTVRRAEPFPVTQGSYRFRLRFTRS